MGNLNNNESKKIENFLIYIIYVIAILFTIFALYLLYFFSSGVHEIKNDFDFVKLADASIPESIHVEDDRWGVAEIVDKDLINDFYQYLVSISDNNRRQNSHILVHTDNILIKGYIYLMNGKNISFELGNNVIIDKIFYSSNSYTTKKFIKHLKDELYSIRNLSNVVLSCEKIEMSDRHKKGIFGNVNKMLLKDAILSAKELSGDMNLWKCVSNQKKFLYRLELFFNRSDKYPSIYMAMYDNGLCLVYYSEEECSGGSILQLKMDNNMIKKIYS